MEFQYFRILIVIKVLIPLQEENFYRPKIKNMTIPMSVEHHTYTTMSRTMRNCLWKHPLTLSHGSQYNRYKHD